MRLGKPQKVFNYAFMLLIFLDIGIPFLLVFLLGFSPIYIPIETYLMSVMSMTIIFLLFTLDCLFVRDNSRYNFNDKKIGSPNKLVFICLICCFFILNGWFNGLNSFRYNTGVLVGGGFFGYGFVLAGDLVRLITLYICCFRRDFIVKNKPRAYTVRLLLIISLITSVSGIWSALLNMFFALILLLPRFFIQVFLFPKKTSVNIVITASIAIAVIPVFYVAFIFGEITKTSGNTIISSYFTAEYLLSRVTPSLHSYMAYSSGTIDSNASWIFQPLCLGLERFNVILGNAFAPISECVSYSYINLQNLSNYDHNQSEGTSPGFLGSFVMSFPSGLAEVLAYCYFFLIRSVVSPLLGNLGPNVSVVMLYLICACLLSPFFASPFDLLIGFDNLALMATLIVCVRIFCLRRVRS